jgi:hypothetical protein
MPETVEFDVRCRAYGEPFDIRREANKWADSQERMDGSSVAWKGLSDEQRNFLTRFVRYGIEGFYIELETLIPYLIIHQDNSKIIFQIEIALTDIEAAVEPEKWTQPLKARAMKRRMQEILHGENLSLPDEEFVDQCKALVAEGEELDRSEVERLLALL